MTDIKPTKRGKLSKKFLMDLKEGLYLVSNVYDSPYKPVYVEKVVPRKAREEQWKRIVNVKANNRLCDIFPSKQV